MKYTTTSNTVTVSSGYCPTTMTAPPEVIVGTSGSGPVTIPADPEIEMILTDPEIGDLEKGILSSRLKALPQIFGVDQGCGWGQVIVIKYFRRKKNGP